MGYFDDFGIVAPLLLTEEALQAFAELNRIFGFDLKVSKSEWGALLEFLGITIDLSSLPRGSPRLFLSELKKAKLRNQIFSLLESKRASSAVLQKLLGELSFAQTATMGKVARAMLRPLYIQSHSDVASRVLSPSALRAPEWR